MGELGPDSIHVHKHQPSGRLRKGVVAATAADTHRISDQLDVAADGQHPVPSSGEHASASACSTRRSLPEVGEFAHTQFITAMLTLPAFRRAPR